MNPERIIISVIVPQPENSRSLPADAQRSIKLTESHPASSIHPHPWYKDAIIYELHVRAFHDSAGEGNGDFRGLTSKLGYLQDLGITAIWLLPFFPSPWRDDGYDISDYTNVHPAYGTLADFEKFLHEAHRRGMRVITEIVLNHTSDQHPWFQKARRAAPGSKARDLYVWSAKPDKYLQARVIFQEFESSNWSWDPVAKAYYWHRFYAHQPDLNYENPNVVAAMKKVIDFWVDLGVDGFRLDAVPYLFEQDGTNCENLPQTHAFLRDLRKHVNARNPSVMLLAEANQWPEDASAYFGDGDEAHMAFHFPVMPRLFMASRMEDRFPVAEILELTPKIPEHCQWATFLRNHDELTLEMVTDEERDYMYRAYAYDRRARVNLGIRRRLAPLLGNDRRTIELLNALLFSLPGTPVIYYGDEIGMGDNIYLGDRNGVRTPMQWSADRNAGFSRANPQKLYLPVNIDPEYHYETVNVEAQKNNPHSLWWWTKRLMEQRKQYQAFGRGTLEMLEPDNRQVLAFFRSYQQQHLLVVANLSRYPQHVELNLAKFAGKTPVEVFGRSEFPRIGDAHYSITLGAHGFYWFSLEDRQPVQESVDGEAHVLPVITVPASGNLAAQWPSLLAQLPEYLPAFLATRRWFQGKDRKLRGTAITATIALPEAQSMLLFTQTDYLDDEEAETYLLCGSLAAGEPAERVRRESADTIVAQVNTPNGESGLLYSAVWNPDFCSVLLNAIAKRRRFRGNAGELAGVHTRSFLNCWGPEGARPRLESAVPRVEQNNTSVFFGDRFILKLFRRLEAGVHPELEMGALLAAKGFAHVPPLCGWLEYRAPHAQPAITGVLHGFVPNQGSAWDYTLHALSLFYGTAFTRDDAHKLTAHAEHPLDLRAQLQGAEIPHHVRELLGAYTDPVRLMGQRVAELHRVLAAETADPAFTPEPVSEHYQQSLYYGMLGGVSRALTQLKQDLPRLPQQIRVDAQLVLDSEEALRRSFLPIRNPQLTGMRMRLHGDLHLGQLLHTGKDFVLIDFEGDTLRPLSERRIKRSPVRDVATMLGSFEYASQAWQVGAIAGVTPTAENMATLERWAGYWRRWASALFLQGYLETASGGGFLPSHPEHIRILLDVFQRERFVADILTELKKRPHWTAIPLRAILRALGPGV